jgi:hypothetical protein
MTDRLLPPHEHETMNGSFLTLAQGRLLILSQGSQRAGAFPFASPAPICLTSSHQAARGVMMMVANHEDTLFGMTMDPQEAAAGATVVSIL